MRRLFAALGTCGLALGVATAAPPVPPAEPPVSTLVEQLGAEDYVTREGATDALRSAGPAAVPALRAAAQSPNPEVRRRAADVLFRLERETDSARLLAPKTVALNYSGAPLGSAVADLAARTGLKLTIDPARLADPLRKVTVATAELPVWEALERFCAAAGLEEVYAADLPAPKPPEGRRGYTMLPQPPTIDQVPIVLGDGTGRPAGARATAVRVVALPRSFPGHRATLGGDRVLCLEIAPAPGLNWQEVVAVKVHAVVDDAGRPGTGGGARPEAAPAGAVEVMAFGGPGVMRGNFDPRTGQPIPPESFPNPRMIPVGFKIATPNARTLRRLEGTVVGEVVVPNQTLATIPNPAANTNRPFDAPGQVRLVVQAVRESKDSTAIQVRLEYPSPWAVGARRGWNPGGVWPEAPRPGATPTLKAFDAKGTEVFAQFTNQSESSDDGQTLIQTLNLTYRGSSAPAKLALVGSRPVTVEVPFVLENVPLP